MVWPMWESKRVIAWRLGSSSVTINSISGRSGPLGGKEGLGGLGTKKKKYTVTKMSSVEWGLVGPPALDSSVAPWGWGEKA